MVDENLTRLTGYVRLGCIQQTLGQFDTARQLFERALDKATTDNAKAEALLCIGMLQAEQGDIDTARKTFGDVPPEVREPPLLHCIFQHRITRRML